MVAAGLEDIKLVDNPAKNFVVIMKDGKIHRNVLRQLRVHARTEMRRRVHVDAEERPLLARLTVRSGSNCDLRRSNRSRSDSKVDDRPVADCQPLYPSFSEPDIYLGSAPLG